MGKPLVVITGASSGIGMATAKLFSKNGYPLLLLARRVEILNEFKLPKTICAKVDVRDFGQLQLAIKKAEAVYGPTDLLVNNAGIMPLEKIYEQDLQDQYNMVDINLKGVLNGMHAVIANMKDRQSGTIINVSSAAGRYTFPDHAVYCGTKYAVHAISEEARRELGAYNVRVSIMAPAIVDTHLLDNVKNEKILNEYEKIKKSADNGLKADDIAQLMLYTYQLPQSISLKEILVSATKNLI